MPRKRMSRASLRPKRRRPPWWFMPAVMSALGLAAALLSVALLPIVQG